MNRISKYRIVLIVLAVLNFFVLGAILGQVDFQINCFYNPKGNWWQFPWGRYKAIFAWEQEYFIIFLTAVVALVIGYYLGNLNSKE